MYREYCALPVVWLKVWLLIRAECRLVILLSCRQLSIISNFVTSVMIIVRVVVCAHHKRDGYGEGRTTGHSMCVASPDVSVSLCIPHSSMWVAVGTQM